MITIKVTYTVNPEFVAKNKENIRLFLNDFKEMNSSDFKYSVYLKDDNVTFVHLSMYKNEIIQNEVLQVASFKNFQKQRDESGLNNSHQVEVLHHFDSSFPTL